MIATEHPDHEANFSKRSAIVFALWQILLLGGRLAAILFCIIHSNWLTLLFMIGVHWAFLIMFICCADALRDSDHRCLCCGDDPNCGACLYSVLVVYPLLFHVSHSSVAFSEKFLNVPFVSRTVLLISIPILFLLAHLMVNTWGSVNQTSHDWYIAILSLHAVSFHFEIIYCFLCHPLKNIVERPCRITRELTFCLRNAFPSHINRAV